MELEAGQFEHHGTVGARDNRNVVRVGRRLGFGLLVLPGLRSIRISFEFVEHGPADVPAYQRLRIGRLVQVADKTRGGGLAVAARDADDRPAAGLEDQVRFGGQRNAPVPRQPEEGAVVPDAGSHHHQVRA